ncbi:hypothetical protein KAI78_04170 [bacterium]|nr:hypothetical protein [bacterium]
MSAAYPWWYVSEERERNWPKMRFPFGLKLFFRFLRCSLLTYRSGYAAFLAPCIRGKIASAIVTLSMNQSTTLEKRRRR